MITCLSSKVKELQPGYVNLTPYVSTDVVKPVLLCSLFLFFLFFLRFMSRVYISTYSLQNSSKARLRFTAVVNFNSMLPQHVQDINILKVTSQWEGREMQEGGGGRLRGREQVTEQESERVFVCVCGREKERERNSSDDRRQAATTL